MKTTIELAREVYGAHTEWSGAPLERLEQLVALVRADERAIGAMEAQERENMRLEKLVAAQPAVPEGWQPIETAPMDVAVLLYGAKRLELCVGMHHSRDGWVTDTTSEWASMYPPTHWMPLPAAPEKNGAA